MDLSVAPLLQIVGCAFILSCGSKIAKKGVQGNSRCYSYLTSLSGISYFLFLSHLVILQFVTLGMDICMGKLFGDEYIISTAFLNDHFLLMFVYYMARILFTIVLAVFMFQFLKSKFPGFLSLMCGTKKS